MDLILQVIALLAVLVGSFFSFLGVVGFVRFPDVYTRLHATGKVGVFGVVFLLVGAMAWTPLSLGKGILLIALLLLTAPGVAHAIGSAAYRVDAPLRGTQRDDLRQHNRPEHEL